MNPAGWMVGAGIVFVATAIAASWIKRLPLSTAIIYLGVGWLIGTSNLAYLKIDLAKDAAVVLRITELTLLFSLFTAGLKLRVPLNDRRWLLAIRLASISMVVTIGCITLTGVFLLKLPVGSAVVLGGMLAATDPVLASDLEAGPFEQNPLQFSFTGEAGLNDGAAFPFVTLGLGLLGLSGIGETGWKWVGWNLLWGVIIGLLIGAIVGTLVAKFILHLRREHHQALGLGYFLVPGLVTLSYGLAQACSAYGFLSVFATGVAVRRVEMRERGLDLPEEEWELAIAPSERAALATGEETAAAYLAQALLQFSEELERLGEIVTVIIVGALISHVNFIGIQEAWFLLLLFLVFRPLSAAIGLIGSPLNWKERGLIGWFGIRGIGSIYYLTYLFSHQVPAQILRPIFALTIAVVSLSVAAHGLSVTPLMNLYARHREPGR
jgi:NhaP-type Na+/H+ or K+/H+ antiporter